MTAKKYVVCFVSAFYLFMSCNLALWHFYVKDMFLQNDLTRLGYFRVPGPVTPNAEYHRKHKEFTEYIKDGMKEKIDVITMGDSFSNGGGRCWYQDCLTDKYGVNVMNFLVSNHCLADLYMLISSGLLGEISPEAVILETVERSVQARLGGKEAFFKPVNRNIVEHEAAEGQTKVVKISTGLFPQIMMEANFNFLHSVMLRRADPERLSTETYITELDRNFFTNPGYENILLYYYGDLYYLYETLDADMVSRNLNAAAEILNGMGIKLIFMPCVDKYDLYYPYIRDKRGRPENKFFDDMNKVAGKEYIFMDTRAVLREALERGEQDIYWFGDTHWGWKGAELVGDELMKYLRP